MYILTLSRLKHLTEPSYFEFPKEHEITKGVQQIKKE